MPALREVADLRVGRRRAPEHLARPRERQQPEHGLQQGGLARAVGAEHGDELALADLRSTPARSQRPSRTAASRPQTIAGATIARRSAACERGGGPSRGPVPALAGVGSWRLPVLERGPPAKRLGDGHHRDAGARGLAFSRWMSGVEFWELKTHTLICVCGDLLLRGGRVRARRLGALADRPHEAGGREQAQSERRARSAKMLSEAPTGTPA